MPTTFDLDDNDAALILKPNGGLEMLLGGQEHMAKHQALAAAIGMRTTDPAWVQEQLDWLDLKVTESDEVN